ncbi:MAG TPA: PadR family transcriptional regulator [Candidatus Dormibacteraeota bacterium]|nr:PadR family transcriptional regulator [Candidatus Dormibacteraeota bacterium]
MSLKYGVLGLLKGEPLHGYEVKNRFEAMLGGTWEVNIGQIYTTLQRLERDGLIRPVGRRGDRGKLAYELSSDGQKALDQWLAEPDSGPQQLHEDIYVKLLLATRIANGDLQGMLARQKRAYLQRLRDLNRLEERARRDGRIDLARLVRGALLHTEADLKWMGELSSEHFGANMGAEAE